MKFHRAKRWYSGKTNPHPNITATVRTPTTTMIFFAIVFFASAVACRFFQVRIPAIQHNKTNEMTLAITPVRSLLIPKRKTVKKINCVKLRRLTFSVRIFVVINAIITAVQMVTLMMMLSGFTKYQISPFG